ncbi:hypothetical protein PC122_g5309 [Phytophthora cactorum]|nr:hypothetical protein PC122_g5309 [Phytophthora cactorum]
MPNGEPGEGKDQPPNRNEYGKPYNGDLGYGKRQEVAVVELQEEIVACCHAKRSVRHDKVSWRGNSSVSAGLEAHFPIRARLHQDGIPTPHLKAHDHREKNASSTDTALVVTTG